MKMNLEEKARCFIQNQYEITQEFIRSCPENLFSRTLSTILANLGSHLWEEFEDTILSDPIIFRIVFSVNTPPEEFDLRRKLFQLFHPISDHRYLCLFAKSQRKLGWEDYLKGLAHDFTVIFCVDLQKSMGKPGTIKELRENFEKVVTDEDGTQRIEIDLWPKARIVQLIKDNNIEIHHYLLGEEDRFEFSNLADETMIGWMQSFEDRELRLSPYEFEKGDKQILCYIYRPDGKLLEKFPYALRNKYENLIAKKLREYDFLTEKGILFGWEGVDISQEAESAFWEAILRYTPRKGPPPGYFKRFLLSRLSGIYRRAKETNVFESKILDREMGDGTPMIEIVRSIPKTDYALASDITVELIGKDPVDKVIAENIGQSNSKIAELVRKKLDRRMTRQAIQKRRTKIEPLLRELLEIRSIMRMDEDRQGYGNPSKGGGKKK
jgi:hypothetical protein